MMLVVLVSNGTGQFSSSTVAISWPSARLLLLPLRVQGSCFLGMVLSTWLGWMANP
jgi:hypothetical protein